MSEHTNGPPADGPAIDRQSILEEYNTACQEHDAALSLNREWVKEQMAGLSLMTRQERAGFNQSLCERLDVVQATEERVEAALAALVASYAKASDDLWIGFADAHAMTGLHAGQITRLCDAGTVRSKGKRRGRKVHAGDLAQFMHDRQKSKF